MVDLEGREFDWDTGNIQKNWDGHGVAWEECEDALMNNPLIIEDAKHSEYERRYIALGGTTSGRSLFIVFTLRYDKIRVISARDQHKKERSSHGG